jgi:uncharacterized protein
MSDAAPSALEAVVKAIEAEFARRPPSICVIGLSGVGKSSTINAMFGTNRQVSATVRGTSRFSSSTFEIVSHRMEGASVKCAFKVYDAPGLGEDVDLDQNYLSRYLAHLPKCDIALWVLAARNRALALDQQYLDRLSKVLPRLVIGINQADLIDPLDWSQSINMPSPRQTTAIGEIEADRHAKLAKFAKGELTVVTYSALKYYNLQSLFAACVKSAPEKRRWMFEIIKSFTTHDWLNRAKGLSEDQRENLAQRYIKSDAKIRMGRPPT